jgi:uncharacterized membrane protein
MVERIFLPLALLGNGMAAGGLVIASLGGAPFLLTLPTEQYVPAHQFLVTRFDPFMPISFCIGLIADLILASSGASTAGAKALTGTAGALLIVALAVSLTKNVPINKWVGRLDPGSLPENFELIDPRTRWRNWNLVRTALAVVALLANVAAVGAVL